MPRHRSNCRTLLKKGIVFPELLMSAKFKIAFNAYVVASFVVILGLTLFHPEWSGVLWTAIISNSLFVAWTYHRYLR